MSAVRRSRSGSGSTGGTPAESGAIAAPRRADRCRPGAALIEMHSSIHSVRAGLAQVMQSEQLAQLSPDARISVEIVLAEVLNNVVEHAYRGQVGVIRLWLHLASESLCCRVEDEGAPMPGGMVPSGEAPLPDSLAEGGFGWALIRSLVEGLAYGRQGRVNCLSFQVSMHNPADPTEVFPT